MVGLDAAGKTTILYKLKLGEVVTTIPTIGMYTLISISEAVWFDDFIAFFASIIYGFYQLSQLQLKILTSTKKKGVKKGMSTTFSMAFRERVIQLEDGLEERW